MNLGRGLASLGLSAVMIVAMYIQPIFALLSGIFVVLGLCVIWIDA